MAEIFKVDCAQCPNRRPDDMSGMGRVARHGERAGRTSRTLAASVFGGPRAPRPGPCLTLQAFHDFDALSFVLGPRDRQDFVNAAEAGDLVVGVFAGRALQDVDALPEGDT